jgi:tetratricopeptide (TPR) repeat protein
VTSATIHNKTDVASLFAAALRHHQTGKLQEAERAYREILALNPRHADSMHLLGMVGYQCGHADAAAGLILQAIALNPKEALYHSNLGVVLNSLGRLDQAVESYQQAVSIRPNYAEAHGNLGNVLVAQSKHGDAMVHLKRAMDLDPRNVHNQINLGVALAEQGEFAEAVPHYEKALELKPDYAEAWSNLGNALQALGRLQEAIPCYQRSLALKPTYLTAIYNLGNAYQGLDDLEQALKTYDGALAIQPDYLQAVYGKALAQLVDGNFVDGWQNYESRWKTVGHKPMPPYAFPRWKGDKLKSGRVLVWGEQGVGDEIMFAGMIPDVLRTGNRCVVDCDARLVPLFARSFPEAEIVTGMEDGKAGEDIGAHVPIGSLPRLFRTVESAFGATSSPYLVADTDQRERFRARYSCGKRVVGVAWHTKNLTTGRSRCIDISLLESAARSEAIFSG